jgi:hypothetical protein
VTRDDAIMKPNRLYVGGQPMHLHNPRLRMKNTAVDPIEQLVDDSAGNLASLLEKTTKKNGSKTPLVWSHAPKCSFVVSVAGKTQTGRSCSPA